MRGRRPAAPNPRLLLVAIVCGAFIAILAAAPRRTARRASAPECARAPCDRLLHAPDARSGCRSRSPHRRRGGAPQFRRHLRLSEVGARRPPGAGRVADAGDVEDRRPGAAHRPSNPRAIYFTDAVTVGYIRGAPLLEFAVQDPRAGCAVLRARPEAAGEPAVRSAPRLPDLPPGVQHAARARDAGAQRVHDAGRPRSSPGPAATTPTIARRSASGGAVGTSPARTARCGTWATRCSRASRSRRRDFRRRH